MTAAADDRLISRQRSATAPAPLPLTARDLPEEPEAVGQVEPLGAGWLAVTIVIGVMAALIALGGMILSFRAVSAEMVPAFGQRWAWLVPIVVDLTVFVFSGVDLVLARLDMGHPLARWTVYGATGGTVWLNYSAGGSAAGRVAHVLMPSIWVVFVELMRHVVRRQVNLATASHREPIPTARWLLSPWPTLKLWRRMVLWRINSYPRALEQEKMRLGAVATAREMYGRFWRLRISPLTKLQINLGELGAYDLRPAAALPGPIAAPAPIPAPMPVSGPGPQVVAVGVDEAAADVGAGTAEGSENGAPATVAGVVAQGAPGEAPTGLVQRSAAPPVEDVQQPAHAAPTRHAAPSVVNNGARPNGVVGPSPSPSPVQGNGVHRTQQTATAGGSEPIPGVAAAGAAAGAAARGIPTQASGVVPSVMAPAAGAAGVPAQRAHAAPPAVPVAASSRRQEPPHVEFQAPPPLLPMPPLPRRSTRESELLTAAREVERWRGQPSATRISRELGIGMALATSLADALRDEDGLRQDEA